MKTCNCGSGKERFELVDAAGIFCAYVCDSCIERKKSGYNSAIFDSNSTYAGTGEELDLIEEMNDE